MKASRLIVSIAIALNGFLIYSYFSNYVISGNASANGFGAVFLIIVLPILNTIFYLLYKVTSKRNGPPNLG